MAGRFVSVRLDSVQIDRPRREVLSALRISYILTICKESTIKNIPPPNTGEGWKAKYFLGGDPDSPTDPSPKIETFLKSI